MCSYDSIKSSIRLLLTSAPNGLTLAQLNADYRCYNQSNNIPYSSFGYSTLFNFLSDMSDIARFDLRACPYIVYGIKPNHPRKRQVLAIESLTSPQANKKTKVSIVKNNKKPFNKTVKRLALNPLSDNNRQSNSYTEQIIRQLTTLTMNPKSLENFSTNQILTISIGLNEQCQVVRYSNGKYFIPCFELSRILNMKEDIIDKETMYSRIRIYQSNDVFKLFKRMNTLCQHANDSHRPFFFLFLISSIIPLLQMRNYINQYYQILLAFEQLMIM